ncbi:MULTISPECIES: hypothetical protein [Streptomyces]
MSGFYDVVTPEQHETLEGTPSRAAGLRHVGLDGRLFTIALV